MTPENLAGLVVGEGCFYAESVSDRKYRSGWRIQPAFCIEMRHDDRAVLEEVALTWRAVTSTTWTSAVIAVTKPEDGERMRNTG